MAKNYMKQVANILGVELDEEFLVDDYECKFKININGLYFYEAEKWWRSVMMPDLLTGTATIKKLPFQPKEGDIVFFPDPSIKCIDQYHWTGDAWDLALKALGMVYRTKEEAEANFKHDCEKLTGKKLEEQHSKK